MIKPKENRLKKANIRKVLTIMKLTLFFLFLGLGTSFAKTSYSQEMRITLDMRNKNLKEIFREIEKQSEFVFFYSDNIVNSEKKVSVKAKDETVNEVLDKIFNQTDNSYVIDDKQIFISHEIQEQSSTSSTQKLQQEKNTLRGAVTDEFGVPLTGVTVAVKGTTRGVVTDINGYYVVETNPGETLVFSFIGFKPYEHLVVGGEQSLNVTLKEDIQELEEAVVVGMGTQRKASVIGSISSVNVSELRTSQPSLTSNLSGRIAGTVAVQRSGEPGNDAAGFWIRGLATFGSNQTPLMLVDGVERSINDISIDEIESVSILKDASATAVYGTRAANGVVVITTRKGVAQKPAIEVKLEYGISDLPNMPEYLDGPNYARLVNEARGYNGNAPTYSDKAIELMENPTLWYHPYLYPNVDWFDEVFKKWGNKLNATISVNGGSDRARYYVTAGYLQNNGNMLNMKGSEYDSNPKMQRYNFRSNVDITITPTTNLSVEIGAILSDINAPGTRGDVTYPQGLSPAEKVFYWANLMTPVSTAVRYPLGYDSAGNQKWVWGTPTQVGEHNPAERLMNSGYERTYNTTIMSQAVLKQKLDFITEGLSAMASFSFDSYNSTIQTYRRNPIAYSMKGYNAAEDKLILERQDNYTEALNYAKSLSSNRAIEVKWQLGYDKIFDDMHRVGAMFMYYQRNYTNGSAGTSILSLPERKQGIAGRATYSYGDRYFAEFNIGYNGSENFPKDNRYGVFPAGAVGYLLTNESFWKFKPINVLKLKGSIGLVGNESLARDVNGNLLRFGYLSIYDADVNKHGSWAWGLVDGNANGIAGLGVTQVGVNNLTWEKGLKKNIGFEMKMFDSSFTLDFDYFHERRTDILTTRQTIPEFVGLQGQNINFNSGIVHNQGFDATIEYNERIGNVDFRVYGNFTYATNKIKDIDEPKQEPYRMKVGHRVNQQFGYIALGLFKDEDDIKSHPSQEALGTGTRPGDVKYLDYNGDGVINASDQTAIGYSNMPEIVYGFGTQVIWKNFDFGVFFRGQDRVSYTLGGSAFVPFQQGTGKGNVFKEAMDRWTPENPNPDAFYPRLSDGGASYNWVNSTRNLYNGRLLRLANLEFGYTLPKKIIAPCGLKNVRFYFVGDNLALFSKWKMWDPETGTQNGNKYPTSRNFNFGVRANF